MTTPIQGLPADPAAIRAALAEHDRYTCRAFELCNPRLVNHEGLVDLHIDGVKMLDGVPYLTAYNYAADNMADADTYSEQEAAHRTRTLTGAELRASREEIRRADMMP